jgi:type II secretory pathway pseudopilin PulG
VPLIGVVIAVALPLTRYALRERYEQTAIEVLRQVQDAQRSLYQGSGAYAGTSRSLTSPCGDSPAWLPASSLERLRDVDYEFELRPARDGIVRGVDCLGDPLVTAYYVAVRPESAAAIARQAFAASNDGQIYLFYDGIPPAEADMQAGLATRVEARKAFKIP